MNPQQQRSLPWLLRCEEHELAPAREILGLVRAAAVARNPADIDRLGTLVRRSEAEHGMHVTLIMHPRDDHETMVTMVVDDSLVPEDHDVDPLSVYRMASDLLERALHARRIGTERFESPHTTDEISLQVSRMASRSGLHGRIEDLRADHARATPLGTGGLHVLIEGGTIDSELEEPWCTPGAVVVSVLSAGHPRNNRTLLRLAAEGWAHDVEVPDALGRLRLEAEASGRNAR